MKLIEDINAFVNEVKVYQDKTLEDSLEAHQIRHDLAEPVATLSRIEEAKKLGILDEKMTNEFQSRFKDAKDLFKAIKDPSLTSKFNLSEIVKSVVNYHNRYRESTFPINENYASDASVIANAPLVKTAVYNFLTNVDRYANDTPKVDVEVKLVDSYVVASVSDEGSSPALDFKDTHEKSINFIFSQGKSAGNGQGNAMYIAQERMDSYDGFISVKYGSKEKKIGSKFGIFLPKAE